MNLTFKQHQMGNKHIASLQEQEPENIWRGTGGEPHNLKKIIGGKMFNTKTAEHIAFYNFDHAESCYHLRETLYRTKNGAFFIVGEGQPLSIYAARLPNCNDYTIGHQLIVLSAAQARQWLEIRGQDEELEEIFGPVAEAGNNTGHYSVEVTLPHALAQHLGDMAEAQCLSVQQFVTAAIETRIANG